MATVQLLGSVAAVGLAIAAIAATLEFALRRVVSGGWRRLWSQAALLSAVAVSLVSISGAGDWLAWRLTTSAAAETRSDRDVTPPEPLADRWTLDPPPKTDPTSVRAVRRDAQQWTTDHDAAPASGPAATFADRVDEPHSGDVDAPVPERAIAGPGPAWLGVAAASPIEILIGVAMWVWVLVSWWRLSTVLKQLWIASRFRARSSPAPASLQAESPGGAVLRMSFDVQAPCVQGVWRPVVLLPTDFVGRFDAPRRRAILAHEAAHVAGCDPAWRILAELWCACWWWHPAASRIRRRLVESSEESADEATLADPDGPTRLAESLVEVGRDFTAAAMVGVQGELRSTLGRRVRRLLMLNQEPISAPRRGWFWLFRCVLPWTAVGLMTLGEAWARPQATPPVPSETRSMQFLQQRWRPALVAMFTVAVVATGADAQDLFGDAPPEREPAREARDEPIRGGRERADAPRRPQRRGLYGAESGGRVVMDERTRAQLADRVAELIRSGRMAEAAELMRRVAGQNTADPRVTTTGGDVNGRIVRLEREMGALRRELAEVTQVLRRMLPDRAGRERNPLARGNVRSESRELTRGVEEEDDDDDDDVREGGRGRRGRERDREIPRR